MNLTVTCDRDAAHLNFSTGGLRVNSLRLAQNCTVLGRRNSSGCDHAVSAHNNNITCLDYHLPYNYEENISAENSHLVRVG